MHMSLTQIMRSRTKPRIVTLIIVGEPPVVPIAAEREFFQSCPGIDTTSHPWNIRCEKRVRSHPLWNKTNSVEPLLSMCLHLFQIRTDQRWKRTVDIRYYPTI